MTKPSPTQSQKRLEESLAPLFEKENAKRELLVLKSSSDVGVMRNGGRNGAKWAPQSLLSVLRRMTQDQSWSRTALKEREVANVTEEIEDFTEAQLRQSDRIRELLGQTKGPILHLGGGHDHIYPLLRALGTRHSRIIVLNVDAHADTRTDDQPHSGTPFRQFAQEYSGDFHLFQAGLHPFANSFSTLTPLPKGSMQILWKNELKDDLKRRAFFAALKTLVTPKTAVVFSLDADAVDGSEVPGVSAVNGDGLALAELEQLWMEYRGLIGADSAPIMGLYELNPVYDSVSQLSMRKMAAFLFGSLRE